LAFDLLDGSDMLSHGSGAMREQEPQDDFPHDKDELLRDFTVASQLRAIRDESELRAGLAPKWWETIIAVVQFAAALGLLTTLVLHTRVDTGVVYKQMVFWGALTVVTLVFGFEFLVLKLYHLRRANELAIRQLHALDRRLTALERKAEQETKTESASPTDAHPQERGE
jgi:hypothetical protein